MRSVLLLALAAFVLPAAAQTPWSATEDRALVSVDARYGDPEEISFVGDDDIFIGNALGSYYSLLLSARIPVSSQVGFVLMAPATLYGVDFGTVDNPNGRSTTSLDIGNPYVGLAVEPVRGAEVEAGVWVPVATSDLLFNDPVGDVGFATDRENFESYKGGVVSARLALRASAALAPSVRVRGEVAPVLSYLTETPVDASGAALDIARTNGAATGSAFADARVGGVVLTAGALGRYDPEGGTDAFDDELWVSGLVGVSYDRGLAHPSLHVRVPLAGRALSEFALGAGVRLPLR